MNQPHQIHPSITRANAKADQIPQEIFPSAQPTAAWVQSGDDIVMWGNDYLQLYINVTLQAGSPLTELYIHLGKGVGNGVFYHDLALLQEDAGTIIKAVAKPLNYVIPVQAPAAGSEDSHYLLAIPINEVEVRLSLAANVDGDPADRVAVSYRRMVRDAMVPLSGP